MSRKTKEEGISRRKGWWIQKMLQKDEAGRGLRKAGWTELSRSQCRPRKELALSTKHSMRNFKCRNTPILSDLKSIGTLAELHPALARMRNYL